MKILSLITTMVLTFNTIYVFKNPQPTKIETLKKSKDIFYNKAVASVDWKAKYLENIEYDDTYQKVLDNIQYDNQPIKNFNKIDPRLVSITNEPYYETWVIINDLKVAKWSDAKNSLKNDDQIVFFTKFMLDTVLANLKANDKDVYCILNSTKLRISGGMPWLAQIIYYKKASNKKHSIWQPVYISDENFCNKDEKNPVVQYIYMNEKKLNLDTTKAIVFGKIFFLNNKFMDSKTIIEIDNSGVLVNDSRPGKEHLVKVPYIMGSDVDMMEERVSYWQTTKIVKLRNPIPRISGWYYKSPEKYDYFVISDFAAEKEFRDKLINFDHENKEKIVKNMLKKHNFFNINVYDKNFKGIDVIWGPKTQNDELQTLTIKLKSKDSTKTYGYKVKYNNIVAKNAAATVVAKQKKIKKEVITYKKEKEAQISLEKEKKKFEQNFSINYQEKKVKNSTPKTKFVFSYTKDITSNLKKIIFSFIAVFILLIMIFRKKY